MPWSPYTICCCGSELSRVSIEIFSHQNNHNPMLTRRRGQTLHLRLLDVCEEPGGLQSSPGIGVLLRHLWSPAPLQRPLQLRGSQNEEILLVW